MKTDYKKLVTVNDIDNSIKSGDVIFFKYNGFDNCFMNKYVIFNSTNKTYCVWDSVSKSMIYDFDSIDSLIKVGEFYVLNDYFELHFCIKDFSNNKDLFYVGKIYRYKLGLHFCIEDGVFVGYKCFHKLCGIDKCTAYHADLDNVFSELLCNLLPYPKISKSFLADYQSFKDRLFKDSAQDIIFRYSIND